jgi:predicted transcriptional regulator
MDAISARTARAVTRLGIKTFPEMAKLLGMTEATIKMYWLTQKFRAGNWKKVAAGDFAPRTAKELTRLDTVKEHVKVAEIIEKHDLTTGKHNRRSPPSGSSLKRPNFWG